MQHRLRWIVVGLLLALTVLTRVPAPFAMEVTNDEMLHLQSWRNRYDTDNIHPEFIERFEKSAKFNQSSARVTLVKKLYWSSPLFQRLALTIHDAHPPAFPVLAELTQKLTGSSLVALRCLSVVASLASVCVAYLLGRELGGPTLGWWTAGFLASASIHQMFAGLGRPYALGTLAALGAVHAFVLDRKRDYRTPWRFYLSALAAQSVLWLLWPTLLPLVLVTAWYAWRRLGMAGLVKATWWYALASLLLFAYLQVQTQHPQYVGEVLNNSIFRAGVWLFFTRIAHATPFGHLAARGTAGIVVSGLVFFALAAAGAVHLARLDAKAAPWRTGLLAAFAVSIGIMLLTGRQRDTMVFLLVPTVVAAVGAHTLCRNELASRAVLAGFLAVFTVVSLFFPDDPYRYVVAGDTRYAEIARRLAAEIKPGDTWVALPEFRGRVFYRCASLPEPLQVTSLPELQQAIAERSSAGSLFVFSRYDYPELRQTLVSGDQLWVFPKDYAIARFAPR